MSIVNCRIEMGNLNGIKVGIDATNLNVGGGRSHILNILNSFNIDDHDISKIVIWGTKDLLENIPDFYWLDKKTDNLLNKGIFTRYLWMFLKGYKEFKDNCDILFSPSGLFFGNSKDYVTMSRNMMLFDSDQIRMQKGKLRIKLLLSRWMNIKSMKYSSGIIFISDYAKKVILEELSLNNKITTKINHGISEKFKYSPSLRNFRIQNREVRLLYISHVYSYKHPWNVVEAVDRLKKEGLNVRLDLVGGGNVLDINRLLKTINKFDKNGDFIKYHGSQPYSTISHFYREADIFIYASTCENMPNILLEAMSASLPIVCSESLPMPEFLEDAGLYFNSHDIDSIANAVREFISSEDLRIEKGTLAYQYSDKYSWNVTTKKTFKFVEEICKSRMIK